MPTPVLPPPLVGLSKDAVVGHEVSKHSGALGPTPREEAGLWTRRAVEVAVGVCGTVCVGGRLWAVGKGVARGQGALGGGRAVKMLDAESPRPMSVEAVAGAEAWEEEVGVAVARAVTLCIRVGTCT